MHYQCLFGSRLLTSAVEDTCMVAERFSEPPSIRATFTFFPPSHPLAMSGANEFIQSGVAHLGLDPATGRPYETAGQMLMMGKICMTGEVTFAQVVFMAWRRQWRHYKKAQMTNTLAIYKAPEENFPASAETFDWDQMDERDRAAAERATAEAAAAATAAASANSGDSGDYKQLMAEIKDLKQKNQQLQQRNQQLQRSQLGMDARNDHNNEQLRRLQRQLDEQNRQIQEQDKQIQQTKTPRKNLYENWHKFYDNNSWNMGPKTHIPDRVQEATNIVQATTPSYAIRAIIIINKAIDTWIDDYMINGGTIIERNVVDNRIVADWGVRVRNRLAERNKSNKTVIGGQGRNNHTPMSIIEKDVLSPDPDSSPERDIGDLNGLRFQNPGGQEPPDDDDDGDDPDYRAPDRRHNRGYGEEDRGKEFRLVNPRNIINITFIDKQLQSNPYLKFSNQIRRLALAMGQEGEQVVSIPNTMETLGNKKYTMLDLERFTRDVLKAMEYDRLIKAALFNWTSGIAQGLVEHGTECGFDAWRKLYNRYVPLADDMQNIMIRQLISIKPVTENEMDSLFDEIGRIREQYIKVGSRYAMSEK